MNTDRRNAVVLAVLLLMLLGLPPVGILLAGLPLQRYAEFPPRTLYVFPAPFSLTAFVIYALFITGCCAPLVVQALKNARSPALGKHRPDRPFPWWGWTALLAGAGVWCLAWTRIDVFAALQPHTFLPLWCCYILVVNAVDYRRTGTSMLTHQTGTFLGLFPVSALFWWVFEYLNRYVQNWHYEVVSYPPLEYLGYATLSFATVLPAVMGTRRLVVQSRWLNRSFRQFRPITIPYPKMTAVGVLVLTAAGLTMVGVWPDGLFPLLWVAPVMILAAAQTLVGTRNLFGGIAGGDWRPVVASAVAALICGFFWEMWNYLSLSRWVYRIPLVDCCRLFEMPLLGYAGYLPFGLTCAAVADAVQSFAGGQRPQG